MKIKTKFFSSSAFEKAQYDPEDLSLLIYFRRGGVYQYQNISPSIWKGLCRTKSAGKYFNKYILPIAVSYQRIS